MDFVWTRGKQSIGIEVKASARWRSEYGRALRELYDARTLTACYGVYLGETPQKDGPVRVLPWSTFLRELAAGRVLAAARSDSAR